MVFLMTILQNSHYQTFPVVNTKTKVSARSRSHSIPRISGHTSAYRCPVSTAGIQINAFAPQDLKVVVVQNNIWYNATVIETPHDLSG